MDFEKCSKSSTNKIVAVCAYRKRFEIRNNNRKKVNKVVVDGCLINDERERCDYLFELDDPMTVVLYV